MKVIGIGWAILALWSVAASAQMSVDFSMVGSSVAGITTPVILNPCTPGGCKTGKAQTVRAPYQPTDALAKQALAGYVGRIARNDPSAAKSIADQFARHDYRKVYDGLTAGSGLRRDDAIDAMTAYTMLGWMIATGRETDIDNATVAAVRAQVASRFSRDPRLNAPGVAGRLGEEMKLLYVTLYSGRQSAVKDGTMRAFSDSVAAMIRAQSGRDPRSLRLTRDGFVEG